LMSDDVYVDDAEEIDLDEAGRLAYSAVVRRLRNDGEAKPVGDTALSKFATFYVEMAERQRAKDEAARPNQSPRPMTSFQSCGESALTTG
jgi:hypothetical protein